MAQGYKQIYGIDYDEIFAPVAKMSIARIIIALSAIRQWPYRKWMLKMSVFMGSKKSILKLHLVSIKNSSVCRLKKFLHGLKQANWAWIERFKHINFAPLFVQSNIIFPCSINKVKRVQLSLLYMLTTSLLLEMTRKISKISRVFYLDHFK